MTIPRRMPASKSVPRPAAWASAELRERRDRPVFCRISVSTARRPALSSFVIGNRRSALSSSAMQPASPSRPRLVGSRARTQMAVAVHAVTRASRTASSACRFLSSCTGRG